MLLNEQIFRAYDVRGVVGRDWDAGGAELVARAFFEFTGARQVVLGWDMRASSEELVAAVERAALAAGITLVKVGRVTTPELYFATANYPGNDAGLMITASHNTGEWNGFKMLRGDGAPIGENSGMTEIKALALAGNFLPAVGNGKIVNKNVLADYLQKVLGMCPLDYTRPLRVVVDYGNGMGAVTNRPLLSALPMVETATMFADPDGSFPNHEANPLKTETLAELQEKVRGHQADFGVAFDGDADRVGFVDETGAVVGGDALTGLIGEQLLKENPGAVILYDLRSRRAVERALVAAGGVAHICRVGHAFIKKQLREENALFAGELSSHFYFRDFFGVECADLMMLQVARLLQETGKPLSELVKPFLVDAHSGEINFTVIDRAAKMAELEKIFTPRAQAVSPLDGLLFDMGTWWFNVRPSNTEPILRLNLETTEPAQLPELLAEVQNIITA